MEAAPAKRARLLPRPSPRLIRRAWENGDMVFNSIPEAVADLKKGRLIVVVDDKDRENEGDVVFAASKSTPAKINFLAKHARGLICVALTAERTEKLRLPPMA